MFCKKLILRFIGMESSTAAFKSVLRLGSVEGIEGKKNEIIYCPPQNEDSADRCVVYFGGDMQDYKENMLAHRDNKHYSLWDLETTALRLRNQFPDHAIVIVKPSKMSLKTFSCYENFTEVNNFGAPIYQNDTISLRQLNLLLQNIPPLLNENAEHPKRCLSSSLKKTISLIGFSKGCVVLNQILHSIRRLQESPDPDLSSFL